MGKINKFYTWGYIKEAALAKLDRYEGEAQVQDFFNRFPIFANECLTQIATSVKPYHKYYRFEVFTQVEWDKLNKQWDEKYFVEEGNDPDYLVTKPVSREEKERIDEERIKFFKNKYLLGTDIKLPYDFISFDTNVNYLEKPNPMAQFIDSNAPSVLEKDPELIYLGGSTIRVKEAGKYAICYKAYYAPLTKETAEETELDIPRDILDCLPSYMASQCYKPDNEAKAAIYRNEFELAFSRISDTEFQNVSDINIKGNW